MKKVFLVLLLFLASCATYDNYADHLDTYIGMHKEGLINAIGTPDITYISKVKTEYLTWKREKVQFNPSTEYTNYGDDYSNKLSNDSKSVDGKQWCYTTFVVSDNKVIKWYAKGNWCVR